jgi:Na+/H+-dicarboxylate symporter
MSANLTQGETKSTNENPEMNWRKIVGGIGIFGLFAAVFIAAGAKDAVGEFPKYMAVACLILIAVSVLGGIVSKLSPRQVRREGVTDKSLP